MEVLLDAITQRGVLVKWFFPWTPSLENPWRAHIFIRTGRFPTTATRSVAALNPCSLLNWRYSKEVIGEECRLENGF